MNYIQDDKLKNILIATKTINANVLSKYDTSNNLGLIDYLLKQNIISYEVISNILYKYFSIRSYKLTTRNISKEAIEKFDYSVVIKYMFLPFMLGNNKIHIVMCNPLNYQNYENIKLLAKSEIEVYFSNPIDIKFFIDHFYNSKNMNSMVEDFNNNETNKSIEDFSIVKIINSIINSSILKGASDIHIEPLEFTLRIRFRIDGVLKEQQIIDKKLYPNIVSRLKIMSGMDISITRYPQDGHFKEEFSSNNVDFRLSTLPTIFGEKIVIRLIYKQGLIFNLKENTLGFFDEDIENIKSLLKNRQGAILVTGPTGSGKTTTLSSFISYLNNEDVNIITIEDPVENIIEGVSQVTINNKIDLNFYNVLRSILRQDPDIIMVGEIRDKETASIAIRAAITGHLVFTTLHTNDALSSISRLLDMGVEDYFITAAVKGIISQRLIRKLCSNCKAKFTIPKTAAKKLGISEGTIIYNAVGCKDCFDTGYKGRFAVYELIIMNNKIKSLIENKASFEHIKETLIKDGMVSIKDNAIKHVLNGNTTLDEVNKVLHGIL